jgi:glyoxalase family protein
MTFFAWPGAARADVGPPQVTATAFAVPSGSLDYWSTRLQALATTRTERLGDQVLRFTDPDGMALEIVALSQPGGEAWSAGYVPIEYAIRGFHSVAISEEGYESTAKVLTELMGFRLAGSEGNRFRYEALGSNGFASFVDLLCVPDARRGGMGAGIVHHVAFRTPNDAAEEQWQRKIGKAGLNVSPVMDRNYFHSIYYREPGGVLFEIATEDVGFTADEAREQLGQKLMLPAQYESHRAAIEAALPKVKLPGAASLASHS